MRIADNHRRYTHRNNPLETTGLCIRFTRPLNMHRAMSKRATFQTRTIDVLFLGKHSYY